jgi:hypothetical protein
MFQFTISGGFMKVSRFEILRVIAAQKIPVLSSDLFNNFRLDIADPAQRSRLYHPLQVMADEKLLFKEKDGRVVRWSITEFGRARLQDLKDGTGVVRSDGVKRTEGVKFKARKAEKSMEMKKSAKQSEKPTRQKYGKLEKLREMMQGNKPAAKIEKAKPGKIEKTITKPMKKVAEKIVKAKTLASPMKAKPGKIEKVKKIVKPEKKIVAPAKVEKVKKIVKADKAPKKIEKAKIVKADKAPKIVKADKAPKKVEKVAPKKTENAPVVKKSGGFKKFTLKKGK